MKTLAVLLALMTLAGCGGSPMRAESRTGTVSAERMEEQRRAAIRHTIRSRGESGGGFN